MKKLFSFFIESVFWFQLFITPVGIGCLIALLIYIVNPQLLWLSIIIGVAALMIGVIYAERIRKKHGTSRYASRILRTPEIWPDEYPEEIAARENEKQKKEFRK